MKRSSWTLGIVIAATVIAEKAESVTLSATGKVVEVIGTAPAGIVIDASVVATWSYDPMRASLLQSTYCEGTAYYGFGPSAGTIHIAIGPSEWNAPMGFLYVQNDLQCEDEIGCPEDASDVI